MGPVLDGVKDPYRRLGISGNIYNENVVVTADTSFSNEEGKVYLKKEEINAYEQDIREDHSRRITFMI